MKAWKPIIVLTVVGAGLVSVATAATAAQAPANAVAFPAGFGTPIYVGGTKVYTPPAGTTTTTVVPTTTGSSTTSTTIGSTSSTVAPTSTTSTIAPTTSSTVAGSTTTVPAGQHFNQLAVGASLPSEATCAASIPVSREQRPANATQNATRGHATSDTPRTTGNYVGTTDMIIRWAACKWGLDEDLLRAETWTESGWQQNAAGDRTYDAGHPEYCGAGQTLDGSGFCPESVGATQVRTRYYPQYDHDTPWTSTAYNLDVLGSELRRCYNGEIIYPTYLAQHGYHSGDMDGCMGFWFSGDWHDAGANDYIGHVYGSLSAHDWDKL